MNILIISILSIAFIISIILYIILFYEKKELKVNHTSLCEKHLNLLDRYNSYREETEETVAKVMKLIEEKDKLMETQEDLFKAELVKKEIEYKELINKKNVTATTKHKTNSNKTGISKLPNRGNSSKSSSS